MCGIVGGISDEDIAPVLLEGLRRLEYRGYDSAGMAVVDEQGAMHRLRALGKVKKLAAKERQSPLAGKMGIAHTRWATHGEPSEINAHPHTTLNELAVVHNGIIENYCELKKFLIEQQYVFSSDTDTEVCAHLIHHLYQQTDSIYESLVKASSMMEGAFALGVIHLNDPGKIYALRKGSPLILGVGEHGKFLGSDPIALQGVADKVIYLEEGDIACISEPAIEIFDKDGELATRPLEENKAAKELFDKAGFKHFMLKEIYEQPTSIAETLQDRLSKSQVFPQTFGQNATEIFNKTKHIHIVACGTSYHAGLVAKYWIESLAQIPCQVEVASEYRYRDVFVPESTLFITVSQSGETADTLAALRKAKALNYLSTLAICNVASSSLVRETELVFLTRAGIEIGVASTKAFTTQLCGFILLTLSLAPAQSKEQCAALLSMPKLAEKLLTLDKEVQKIAVSIAEKQNAMFVGRGTQFPVALEGALKLKEISYIHAEAYPAGELKHGPLALIDADMPVIAVAPNDELIEKLSSNLEEVKSRGGVLYVFADESLILPMSENVHLISVPTVPAIIAPIVYTIPLQLLAYHVAVLKGTDVDQPRNLAKSVTVE